MYLPKSEMCHTMGSVSKSSHLRDTKSEREHGVGRVTRREARETERKRGRETEFQGGGAVPIPVNIRLMDFKARQRSLTKIR